MTTDSAVAAAAASNLRQQRGRLDIIVGDISRAGWNCGDCSFQSASQALIATSKRQWWKRPANRCA